MYCQTLIMTILLFVAQFIQSRAQIEHMSFNIDLIHRDSPQSPIYNDSLSSSQLFARDVERSRARVNRSNRSSSYTHEKVVHVVDLIGSGNNYLMSFYIGSEKVRVFVFLDLSTDFIWTRCDGLPFDFQQSNTHFVVPLNHELCNLIHLRKDMTSTSPNCRYEYDVPKMGLSTSGFVITDDFFFRDYHTKGSKVVFGCADSGLASADQLGVVGFGIGELSLPYQIERHIKGKFGDHKFSYCLKSPKEWTTSRLKLGALPRFLEQGLVQSTLQHHRFDHAYYLNLKGISIGGSDLPIPSPHLIKIDPGITITFLEDDLYKEVQNMITEIITTTPTNPTKHNLCYRLDELGGKKLPDMVFHFADEASFHKKSESVFIKNDVQACMSIFPTEGTGPSVFGSNTQEGHIIQFDLKYYKVSFTKHRMDCENF